MSPSPLEEPACPFCGRPSEELWRDSRLAMMRCSGCVLHWARSRKGPAWEPQAYGPDYYRQNYLPRLPSLRRFFHEELERVSPRAAGRRVLDVGFGVGAFLEEALRQGWTASGVESSEAACDHARQVLGERASLHLGRLADAPFPEGSFDLVSFWDVLAHVPSPREDLLKAKRLLKEGGLLIVKTPARPAGFFASLRPLSLLSPGLRRSLVNYPARLFHFHPEGLPAMLERLGFRGVELRVTAEPAAAPASWLSRLRHPRGLLYDAVHRVFRRRYPPSSLIVYAVK